MRSTFSSGTRVQYTQPPNGSLNGMPSMSTSERLTPLGPMPRSDTPCAVGCDDRLLVRRNRLKVGAWRSTSSATTAGDRRICSLSMTLTLAGTSASRCSVRVGVTDTDSKRVGRGQLHLERTPSAGCDFSAKPLARTTMVAPEGTEPNENLPSGPVTVCCSEPEGPRAMTAAPATTPPVESLTTPDTPVCADADRANTSRNTSRDAVRMTGKMILPAGG